MPDLGKGSGVEALVEIGLRGPSERAGIEAAGDAVVRRRLVLPEAERDVGKGAIGDAAIESLSVSAESRVRVEEHGLSHVRGIDGLVPVASKTLEDRWFQLDRSLGCGNALTGKLRYSCTLSS